ncbi:BTB (POZ) domain-containing protein [Terramyces sp. JEL0728]|nr:BTB (POZ) domain-containing protein [Terramyces sp. JEL0728]
MKAYSYTWSELLIAPQEFEFGPKETESSDEFLETIYTEKAKYTNADNFKLKEQEPAFTNFDVSSFIINFAINSAVFLKSTQVPDILTDLTANAIEFGSVMDQHYAIKEKVKQIGHAFVTALVAVFSTFITAILQAMIAYHNAPGVGREERKMIAAESRVSAYINNDDCLVTFSVGGQSFTTQLQHLMSRKRTYLGRLVFNRKNNSAVFIDRDGTHFRHILNHLRGTIYFIVGADSISHIRDKTVLNELLEETRFYELDDMSSQIIEQLSL